ncbi:hypothetical protein PCYB_021740 [Plasmodium cynomolgi strain B]|uniref:Uncharacterized protein n=1 Tax=Plasmodium cynomolgi (strain B) TaxID=1120755 RepID=K6URU7_PLACD|nr:hypothetical protein PCYB_021740 [Plasmodium cynomolgi strain B]GAB64605.1 hypothetical protein PCYB_021740 [Plasmodium cynomolgi strain B]
MKYLLCLLHVIVLFIYRKEQEGECHGGLVCDSLAIDSNHYGDHGVEGQAGGLPLAEGSYTDEESPYNAAEEGASSTVGRGAIQRGGHPPEGNGGPIDPYGSYGSSPHDDGTDDSGHPKHGGAGAGAGAGAALGRGSPYEAGLGNNVKVIHMDRLKVESKGELINKIRGILNTLE